MTYLKKVCRSSRFFYFADFSSTLNIFQLWSIWTTEKILLNERTLSECFKAMQSLPCSFVGTPTSLFFLLLCSTVPTEDAI